MTEKLRVGVFGIGHGHALAAVSTLIKRDDVEIVGLWEDDDAMYEKRYKENPALLDRIKRVEKEQLFGMDLDAAMVETTVPKLVATATEAANHGLHVHMDKPAGIDLDEYKKFLDVMQEKHLVFQTGYMYRYNAGFRYIKEKISEGKLGKIYNITTQMNTKHPVWFKELLMSYNVKAPVMYIFGCHLIDLCMLAKGEPQKIDCFHSRSGNDGLDFEDTSVAVLTYPDGIATVKVSSVEPNGWGTREFSVYGENGSICIRPLENPMIVHETYNGLDRPWNDVHETVEIKEPGRYDVMMKEFVEMIRGDIAYNVDFDYEYNLQRNTLLACGYDLEKE